MYTLQISSKAEKEIKKIAHPYQKAIILAFEEIKDEPFLGKPLTRKLTGRFTYKVGVYRIIYRVNKKDKVVNILSAGHRATIYL